MSAATTMTRPASATAPLLPSAATTDPKTRTPR
jgi:hypothetical protein